MNKYGRPVKFMTEKELREELSNLKHKLSAGEADAEEAQRAIEIKVAINKIEAAKCLFYE